MLLPHAHTLAQARTCLAALADAASSEDVSSAYEHVLIELDRIHCDESPDIYLDAVTQDQAIQFEIATSAIEDLKGYGVDALSVELVLWMLEDAYSQDCTWPGVGVRWPRYSVATAADIVRALTDSRGWRGEGLHSGSVEDAPTSEG
jgi:hypothetical protein